VNRGLRAITRRAEALGIEVVSIQPGSRHILVRLRNKAGVEIVRTMSHNGSLRGRHQRNNLAQMKRFARGELHGLKIASKPQK
jgi:hypothetical protein